MWPLKIIVKLIVSNLPIPYRMRTKLGCMQHGFMEDPDYGRKVFEHHKNICFPDGLPENFTALELGPGDSLASMLMAASCGAEKIWLVDAGTFAREDTEFYKQTARALRPQYPNMPEVEKAQSLQEMMNICRAQYVTGGLASLKQIPDNSVDLIWSQAVLEHVWKDEFNAVQQELRRVLKPSGRASHVIDFQDHLNHALNNLRFSEKIWETGLVRKSGFYTNRILASESVERFKICGFSNVQIISKKSWDAIPTPRKALNPVFQGKSDDDLLTQSMTVCLS